MKTRTGDWVDNAPIRRAVEGAVEGGTSYTEMCKWLGWTKPDGGGDTSRLKRRLGIMAHAGGRGCRRRRVG